MENRVDASESEDEMEEAEMEEETQRKKKRRRSTTTSNAGETSSDKPAKKTGRRKDPAWKHATKKGDSFKCKYCEEEYKGGVSRIKAHLRLPGNKGGLAPCPSRPPSLDEGATNNFANTTDSPERDTQLVDHDPEISLSPNRLCPESDHNATIPSSTSPVRPQFDHAPTGSLTPHQSSPESDVDPIAHLTSPSHPQSDPYLHGPLSPGHESRPQETTDIQEYKGLVKHLIKNNVPFPPNPPTCFKESLLSIQTEVEQYVQMVKESWSNTGCTVKYHFRKKKYDDLPELSDIIGYTIYSPRGVIFLNPNQMEGEVKKVEEAETFVLFDLEHENDPRDNLFSFAGAMEITGDSQNISYCAPVMILELLHIMCEKSNWISDLIKDAKSTCEVLTRKDGHPSEFEHPFSDLQVVMQNKEQLESVFSNQSDTSKKKFWEDVEEVLNAVRPLIQILNLFDSFVPNIGYFYEAIERAEKWVEHYYKVNQEKFKVLWESFGQLKVNLIKFMHIVAAYLNPNYELTIEPEMETDISEYMKDYLVRSEEYEAFENEMAKYNRKDKSLFTDEAILALKDCHPVRWWEKFGEPFPILRRCAIRLLCQPSNCLSHLSHKRKFEALKFEDTDMFRLHLTMMQEFKELVKTDMIFKPLDLSIIGAPLN